MMSHRKQIILARRHQNGQHKCHKVFLKMLSFGYCHTHLPSTRYRENGEVWETQRWRNDAKDEEVERWSLCPALYILNACLKPPKSLEV